MDFSKLFSRKSEDNMISKEKLIVSALFFLLLIITLYNLSGPSLNVDEGTEFWYSRYLDGPHPHAPGKSMYQRILMTFQPPLYNFLMYFWLKISHSVFHFRVFGVLCALAAGALFYASAKKITGWHAAAAFAMILFIFNHRMFFYWQEASEYCIVLFSQFMAVYFLIRFMVEPSIKNVLYLSAASVVSIYSQYGAVFAVVGFGVCVAFSVLFDAKERKMRLKGLGIYGASILVTGIPLYFLFFKKQLDHMNNGKHAGLLNLPGFKDFFVNIPGAFRTSLSYTFFSNLNVHVLTFCAVIITVMAVAALINGSRITKILGIAFFVSWLSYYSATISQVYAYGDFYSRHSLFIIPLLFSFLISVLWDVFVMLRKKDMASYFAGIFIICVVFMAVTGLRSILEQNNGKIENNRQVVDAWYAENGYLQNTFVYYGAEKSFSYYIRQNDLYMEDFEKAIVYMGWEKDKGKSFYKSYIEKKYGEKYPETLYFAAAHIGSDIKDILDVFSDKGYSGKTLYDDNGMLIKLSLGSK